MSQETLPPVNPDSKSTAKGFVASVGAAAKLVGLQAERTRLTTLTLPAAYRTLGNDCVQQKRHLDGVKELIEQLQAVVSEIKALSEISKPQASNQSFTDKAKAAGKQAVDFAQIKQLEMKRESLCGDIGKAIYETHKESSGSKELVSPIQVALQRVAELDSEIARVEKGSWITRKYLLFVAAGIVVSVVFAFFFPGKSKTPLTDIIIHEKYGNHKQISPPKPPRYTDLLSPAERQAMEWPVKVSNLYDTVSLAEKNRGLKFFKTNTSPFHGRFLQNSITTKDITFDKKYSSVVKQIEVKDPKGNVLQHLYFYDYVLSARKDYSPSNNKEYESHYSFEPKYNKSIEYERFFINGLIEKTVWYHPNGKIGAICKDDPRSPSASSEYWDEKGNVINQEQFCQLRYGDDWKKYYNQSLSDDKEANIRAIQDAYNKLKK